jgi:hypothetical protein
MSIKATSLLRSAALLGVAVAALVMAPVATMAIDQGFAPRPDFPGAKQAEGTAGKAKTAKTPRSTSKSTSKSHAQRMHGKHHAT